MRKSLALMLTAMVLQAQQGPPPTVTLILPVNANRYSATDDTTKLTLQIGANSGVIVRPEYTEVTCGADSTLTLSWSGTAATTTAITRTKAPRISVDSAAIVYTDSNVGAGTTGPAYTATAGVMVQINWTMIELAANGPVQNLTLTTDNSCVMVWHWREERP